MDESEIIKIFNQGLELQKKGHLRIAQTKFEEVLRFNPLHYDALELACAYLAHINDWNKAKYLLSNAIEINKSNPYLYNNFGIVLYELKNYEESISAYNKAIKLKPNFAEALSNLANVYRDLGLLEKALINYEKAISINSNYAIAYSNKSIVLKELKLLEDALKSANTAIQKSGGCLEQAYNNLGIILYELRRYEESLRSYDLAIAINPNIAEVFNNRGNTLKELKLIEDAIASFNRAVELKVDYAEAYSNLGIIFQDLRNYEEALINFKKAFELKPDLEYLEGLYLHTKMEMCDWQNYQISVDHILSSINAEKRCTESFPILALIDAPSIHKKITEITVNNKYPSNKNFEKYPIKKAKNKITLGYYSSDFREHPVSYLTAELFELHDKSKFELIAFYSGQPDPSQIHIRISSSFSKFINISHLSDKRVAELSREIGVDIAIDLTGLTQNNRVGVFSYRAAPIQLSYIGYLGTMGAMYYDYLIADKTIVPESSQHYYNEKIIYLRSYQVNDSKRYISEKVFTRTELNLPEDAFVFCCFNNHFKISPSTFDGWMRILHAVPNSVLYVYAEKEVVQVNLKKEALQRGVAENRLIFGAHIERSEYLARYKSADLFLDTFPYNAGTTASDALWAGLPVLTCMGESFASRVAASILNAIGLPELITKNQKEYETTAIKLATEPQKLNCIKEKLKYNRLTTTLFNTPLFTKNIETAYTEIYKQYLANLPPENIYVDI